MIAKTNKTIIPIITGFVLCSYVQAQDGESLFKSNCASCHTITTKRLVGPGLGDVKGKRSNDWLFKWIKDSQALIKSGDADAIAIFEEYNKSMMPPFTYLSDAEIQAMVDYLPAAEAAGEKTAEVVIPEEAEAPIEYTEEDALAGQSLFEGSTSFVNGGPSCLSCHNVTNDALVPGGLLAKDLTNVFERMGHAGISGILSAPPFPAMANSYGNQPLTESEVFQLCAFFKKANEISSTQKINSGYSTMLFGGITGLIVLLVLILILWNNRKKESVKKAIFDRQIKGKDSVES